LPRPPALLVHAVLIGVSVLFGINFVGMKLVLEQVPAPVWALCRIGAATLVLVPLGLVLGGGLRLPPRRTLLALVPAAILGVGGNQLLFALGLERTTPAHSSVITACVPILTLVAATLAGQERATLAKVSGIALALAGVLTLLGVDRLFAGGPARADTLVGDLLTLANATGYSVFLVMMRRIAREVPAPTATAICFVYSTLFLLPIAATDLEPGHLRALTTAAIWPWALFAVLGATVATYLLNTWALRHADSSLVALYIYTQPVVATALSIALGRDRPGPRFFAAAGLVFAGLCAGSLPVLWQAGRRAQARRAGRPSGTTSSRPT
jgi:drug/metabolite transporter (DMT)-like permease